MQGTAEARAKQEALEKATPQLKITEQVLRLDVPGETIGDAVGVAKNSKGHLFVFSRTGKTATVVGSTTSQVKNGKVTRSWSFWDMTPLLGQLGLLPPM